MGDPRIGREREGIFCRGEKASTVYVEFDNNNAMWKFLQASMGKSRADPNTQRKISPEVYCDKEDDELGRRVGRAFIHLRRVILEADPTYSGGLQ